MFHSDNKNILVILLAIFLAIPVFAQQEVIVDYKPSSISVLNDQLRRTTRRVMALEGGLDLSSSTITGILPVTKGGTGLNLSLAPAYSIPVFTATGSLEVIEGNGDTTKFFRGDGTFAVPAYPESLDYFADDSSVIFAFHYAEGSFKDLSPLHNTLTVDGLDETDASVGIVSPIVYTFVDTNWASGADVAAFDIAAITIEATVHKTATNTDGWIVSRKVTGVGNDPVFGLQFNDTNILFTTHDGVTAHTSTKAHGLSGSGNNQDVYIVATYDPQTNGEKKVYVNGVQVGTTDTPATDNNLDASDQAIYVGEYTGGASPNNNNISGKIDGVRILDRVMSAAEIAARYERYF